jgi:hypothetical protein
LPPTDGFARHLRPIDPHPAGILAFFHGLARGLPTRPGGIPIPVALGYASRDRFSSLLDLAEIHHGP